MEKRLRSIAASEGIVDRFGRGGGAGTSRGRGADAQAASTSAPRTAAPSTSTSTAAPARSAAAPIAAGDHVHTHNVGLRDFARDHAFGVDARPTDFAPVSDRATFAGYRRPDGRAGTRNFVAVLSLFQLNAKK